MEIDWQRILLNDQPLGFLVEIAFRTLWMFLVVVLCLKISGKRGVKQLSIFEMVMIISMGSAAGDPMFYEDVAIIHAMLVLAIILGGYRLIVALIARSEKIELLFEGKPICLIEEGKMSPSKIQRDNFGIEDFFAQLRNKCVEHLGQVRYALLETNGTLSVYYYPDQEVRPGLPIIPALYWEVVDSVKEPGYFACAFCGNVEKKELGAPGECEECNRAQWVKAICSKRI